MEVISILGNPTSSSGEQMFYQGSEIDFKNGQVAGWKIDSKSGDTGKALAGSAGRAGYGVVRHWLVEKRCDRIAGNAQYVLRQ